MKRRKKKMEITEIETKVPIPAGKLSEVLYKFGTLGRNNCFFCENKEDVYLRDDHGDIGYDKKVLRIRSVEKTVPCHILRTDRIFTDQAIGILEDERDIDGFMCYAFGPDEIDTKVYVTSKLKSVKNGYENNTEEEITLANEDWYSPFKLFKTLGLVKKFSKCKFSIFYTLEAEPFNIEIVYVSKDSYDKNGVWYVEIETTKELQDQMGTQDWKTDEYEGRICRIFQQLGLDPATKDNRNWQDILGIETK